MGEDHSKGVIAGFLQLSAVECSVIAGRLRAHRLNDLTEIAQFEHFGGIANVNDRLIYTDVSVSDRFFKRKQDGTLDKSRRMDVDRKQSLFTIDTDIADARVAESRIDLYMIL